MSCALAVWVKTPGLSPVKTRLAADVGQARALAIYEACVAATAAVVEHTHAEASAIKPHWAVAEPDALDAPRWLGWPRVAQGEGNLGDRLASVYAALHARHEIVLFIGADAPQVESTTLVDAWRRLRSGAADFVLGRASDGGFWLFGGRRPLPDAVWTEVVYSRDDTARMLAARLEAHGQLKWLPTLQDLDHARDIAAIIVALRALPAPLPAQQHLLSMLEDLKHKT